MEMSELKAELQKHHDASFGWALSCCRHHRADAEEVLQTVYLKILQGKARYRGEASLQTWLFAVIRKTAISERRRQLLRTLISNGGAPKADARERDDSLNSQPSVEYERSEMQRRFQQALKCLPARQQETLHLVFYQGLSLREAADVMGISIGSVRRHYERGKKRLREELDQKEVGYGLGWRQKENSGVVP
jgi:RNA polymerase sigma-70 factor, ECF subfamily